MMKSGSMLMVAAVAAGVLVSGGCASEHLTGPARADSAPTAQAVRAAPLYVLDGRVITAQESAQVDTRTITDVQVLKGDAAVARFGQTAQNGAVIITTRAASHP